VVVHHAAEKEAVLVGLHKDMKLFTQKEAAFNKQQKAMEAQVRMLCGRTRCSSLTKYFGHHPAAGTTDH
jgi:hypothetical protein